MKKLVIFIMLLSIFDAICTAVGVSSSEVIEANPLLSPAVMASPWVSCSLVCAGACALVWLVYSLGRKIKWVNYALAVVLLERVAIAMAHVVGIAYTI